MLSSLKQTQNGGNGLNGGSRLIHVAMFFLLLDNTYVLLVFALFVVYGDIMRACVMCCVRARVLCCVVVCYALRAVLWSYGCVACVCIMLWLRGACVMCCVRVLCVACVCYALHLLYVTRVRMLYYVLRACVMRCVRVLCVACVCYALHLLYVTCVCYMNNNGVRLDMLSWCFLNALIRCH